MTNKIDSSVTALAYAEETALRTLAATPNWFGLEPNTYSDFGGQVSLVARQPINASRQQRRGSIVDLDASGGFNQDLTKSNLTRLLQGFFFASLREKFSTMPFNGTALPITSVSATQYLATTGLTGFKPNQLVFASGFANAANNGLKVLSASAAGSVTTTGNVVESAPPATAKLESCGVQFVSGDVALTYGSGRLTLTSATVDLTTLGLNVGEWVFIGGDTAATQFALNAPFYARIDGILTTNIVFDKTTIVPVADPGTGKTVQMFFGYVLQNEYIAANIIRRSYNIERQLGNDGSGIQAEYLEGAVANELTIKAPQADKVNADLSFVAMANTLRTGSTGVKSGNRIAAPGEDAYNTSSDVYRICMRINDPLNLNPTPLVGYCTEADVKISNGVTPAKAVGVLGAIDTSAGDFVVTGTVTAYFINTTASSAIRANADCTFDMIFAKKNAATWLDIPLLGLGNGRLAVSKDAPITIPLDSNAAQSVDNFTLMMGFMPYVPTIALPAAQ